MKEAYGNMLDTTCEVLVVSTNGYVKKDGSCVMGRGIAEQISNLSPEVAFTLGGLITEHGNNCHILSHPTNRNVGFVSFPVKPVTSHVLPDKSNVVPHARNKVKCGDLLMGFWSIANLRLIEDSCKQLVRLADDNGWSDILCPRFGCGAGELRWQDVKPICEKYLDNRFTVMTFKEDQVLETQFQKSTPNKKVVFLSGSMGIHQIPIEFEKEVKRLQSKGFNFIVGDCFGVDKLVQDLFVSEGWINLTVYHVGDKPRFNTGRFKTMGVQGQGVGREYYTTKDITMTEHCTNALMVWDGKSKGTLSNKHRLDKSVKAYKVYEVMMGGKVWIHTC